MLGDAARRTTDRALRAALLAEAARADLARGHDDPALRRSAYEAALALADRRHAKGDAKGAAASLSSALTLAFPGPSTSTRSPHPWPPTPPAIWPPSARAPPSRP